MGFYLMSPSVVVSKEMFPQAHREWHYLKMLPCWRQYVTGGGF